MLSKGEVVVKNGKSYTIGKTYRIIKSMGGEDTGYEGVLERVTDDTIPKFLIRRWCGQRRIGTELEAI